jgi:undecaprenyl-diphosphatase
MKISRSAAAEFSFFLAVPTLLAAGLYDLYKHRDLLSSSDLSLFGIGTVTAFISAFICIRWLLRYVTTHNFRVFAWYRIVFGLLILLTSYSGLIHW